MIYLDHLTIYTIFIFNLHVSIRIFLFLAINNEAEAPNKVYPPLLKFIFSSVFCFSHCRDLSWRNKRMWDDFLCFINREIWTLLVFYPFIYMWKIDIIYILYILLERTQVEFKLNKSYSFFFLMKINLILNLSSLFVSDNCCFAIFFYLFQALGYHILFRGISSLISLWLVTTRYIWKTYPCVSNM